MKKEFAARRLDIRAFAEEGASLSGAEAVDQHPRLLAETAGRGRSRSPAPRPRGELRNPGHVHPEVWLHLKADATLPLTCQRCLHPVEVPVGVDRAFRFVADEATAAAEDDQSEEDLLVLSRAFDLLGLIEDELLMEMPVAPRHEVCPEPVKLAVADEDFEAAETQRPNPFAQLEKLKGGGGGGKS